MRYGYFIILLVILTLALFFCSRRFSPQKSYCLTGAFLADNPTRNTVIDFKKAYGKKPFIVMVFSGWGDLPAEKTIQDVYGEGCVLMVTWEPWDPSTREAVDYDAILAGGYDDYIVSFARRMASAGTPVFIRFAHEMNGNWYPWCGPRIGREKYIALYRYVKDKFDEAKVTNAQWIFSVNWEDVPNKDNYFMSYYPGDGYVDFIGIDGYNWGNTRSWSRWRSFQEIFGPRLGEIEKASLKPVIITEFGSTSQGGDKSLWIREALLYIGRHSIIRAFVLFNVDKETDWSFPPDTLYGQELRSQLESNRYRDSRP